MIDTPKECAKAGRDYLASSDDIYSWFNEYYEKETDGETNVLYLDEIYSVFKATDYYFNLPKEDKRDNNKTKFCNKLKTCLYLKSYIKEADTRYGKDDNGASKKHDKPYLIQYKKKMDDEIEQE